MIEIVPGHRALLGGMVAGLIGLAVAAGGTASADPQSLGVYLPDF
ncbi:hypothetical protein [Mycobacterium avium]|nr:hypothetical protein [Mycobacterium avium]